jgi:hypothetical protein
MPAGIYYGSREEKCVVVVVVVDIVAIMHL